MISPKSPAPPRRESNNIPHSRPHLSQTTLEMRKGTTTRVAAQLCRFRNCRFARLFRFAKLASHRFREGLSKALHRFRLYLNILPIILVAMLPARLPEDNALPAMFEAWLNLSQRENARELVTVRTSAIATGRRDKVSQGPRSRSRSRSRKGYAARHTRVFTFCFLM